MVRRSGRRQRHVARLATEKECTFFYMENPRDELWFCVDGGEFPTTTCVRDVEGLRGCDYNFIA